MARRNLLPHIFISEDKHGHREERIFYAPNAREARTMAQRWGRRTGHKMFRRKRKP